MHFHLGLLLDDLLLSFDSHEQLHLGDEHFVPLHLKVLVFWHAIADVTSEVEAFFGVYLDTLSYFVNILLKIVCFKL